MSVRNSRWFGLPGGGPWRILDECPGTLHNTLYAATRAGRKPGYVACICPRAVACIEEDRPRHRLDNNNAYARRRAERAEAAKLRALIEQPKSPVTIRLVRETPVPDMTNAACGTDEGQKIMERVIMRSDIWNNDRAQELCASCPIKRQCGAWALSAEVIPGSWGGVYGGMTAKDRKDVAATETNGVAA